MNLTRIFHEFFSAYIRDFCVPAFPILSRLGKKLHGKLIRVNGKAFRINGEVLRVHRKLFHIDFSSCGGSFLAIIGIFVWVQR